MQKKKKKIKTKQEWEQPCFSCQKAVAKCPWSINFTPIEGWIAEKTVRKLTGETGYKITYCPLFIPDEPRYDKRGRLIE